MHPVKKPHPLGPNKVRLLGGVQYTLDDEPIANGSEGIVYRATPDPWHGHRVAIKVCVRQDGRHTPEAQHEAEMLQLVSQSQHPNILNFIHFEHGVAGGDPPLLVMELMDDSLFDLISNALPLAHERGDLATQGVMADNAVRAIFRQLVAGALHLHALGLSHGDIKPENIGLIKGHVLQVKLLDFGHTRQHGLGNFCAGTQGYAAPELLSRNAARTLRQPSALLQSYDDEKADVWALGWTIALLKLAAQVPEGVSFLPGTRQYHVLRDAQLAGKNGFLALQDAQPGLGYRSCWSPIWSTVLHPQLADLLNRMLHHDPAQRLTLKEVADHPWLNPGSDGNGCGGSGDGSVGGGGGASGGGGGCSWEAISSVAENGGSADGGGSSARRGREDVGNGRDGVGDPTAERSRSFLQGVEDDDDSSVAGSAALRGSSALMTDPGVPYDEEDVVLVHRSFAAFSTKCASLEWQEEAHRTLADEVQHHSDRSAGADEAQSRVQSRVRQDELPMIYRSLANERIYDDVEGEEDDTPAYRSLGAGPMSGELLEADASPDMPRIYRSVANERIYDDDEGGSQF